MKFDDTPSREEREDFWLDLGPASAYEGLDCCETARRDGDASPDGLARWAVPMMYRPSTDKGREKSYRNKIHLLV